MPTLEDQDQNQDQRLPREDLIDEQYSKKLSTPNRLRTAENEAGGAFDEIAKNYDKTADDTQENANINKIRQQEESNTFGYNKSANKPLTGDRATRFKTGLKKYGPSGGIIGIIFGGIFGFGTLFTPALGIIHLKEVITGDLNDQDGAMILRTNKVFASKLNTMGKPFSSCTLVKFRCGLKGLSDYQIKSFEQAGVKVNTLGEKNPLTRKTAVQSLTFPTSSGGTKELTNIRDIMKAITSDTASRTAFHNGYNPTFFGIWDKASTAALQRIGVSKADKLKDGKTDKDFDKLVDTETDRATTIDPDAKNAGDNETDEERQQREAYNKSAKEFADSIAGSKGVSGLFKSSLGAFNVLNIADDSCSVLNASFMVESGAKFIRARQVATYAMIFLTAADMIKSSDPGLTPEKVSYIGTKLSETDNRKKVVDETSSTASGQAQEVDNPDYGKNAFDSDGYKAAAYNDAPTLSARAQQFTVGGGMVGSLAAINALFVKIINGGNGSRAEAKAKCKIVQNGFVRGAGMIVGGVAAFFTGGASLAIKGIAEGVLKSVAFGFAINILEGYLKDMIAGDTVGSKTAGVDAGNAIFAGAGVILGNIAMSRGMQPANKSQLKAYQAAIAPTMNQYIADETEAAKSTPFDISNQYSFLGSLSRKFFPVAEATSTTTASLPTFLSSVGSLVSSALLPQAKADNEFNEDRYSKCDDEAYEEMGIDADIMCNVRYTLTPAELAMDKDANDQWMYDNHYVSGDDGSAISDSHYADWLKECTERIVGWGNATTEEGDDTGADCLDKNAGKTFSQAELQHFRVYTMDQTIEEGMDDGPTTGASNSNNTDDGTGSVDGSIADLAKIILDNSGNGKTFNISGGYSMVGPYARQDAADRSNVQLQLEDLAAGKEAHLSTRCTNNGGGTVTPDINLLKFLADAAQNSGLSAVQINALFGQCHSNGSNHYKGKAVDLGCNGAASASSAIVTKLDAIGAKYGVKRNFETCAANDHWHYSVGGN